MLLVRQYSRACTKCHLSALVHYYGNIKDASVSLHSVCKCHISVSVWCSSKQALRVRAESAIHNTLGGLSGLDNRNLAFSFQGKLYSFTYSLSLTHSLTHSLTNSLTHTHTHAHTHMHTHTYPYIRTHTHTEGGREGA